MRRFCSGQLQFPIKSKKGIQESQIDRCQSSCLQDAKWETTWIGPDGNELDLCVYRFISRERLSLPLIGSLFEPRDYRKPILITIKLCFDIKRKQGTQFVNTETHYLSKLFGPGKYYLLKGTYSLEPQINRAIFVLAIKAGPLLLSKSSILL